jgi:hypothetical protein
VRQSLNLGTPTPGPGMPGADTRYDAFRKTDENFAELYGPLGLSVVTTDFTLSLPQASGVIECNNAVGLNVTVPTFAAVAFPLNTIIEIVQVGAGAVSIVAASGVVLRNADNAFGTRAVWSSITLRKRATNEWVVSGDTA